MPMSNNSLLARSSSAMVTSRYHSIEVAQPGEAARLRWFACGRRVPSTSESVCGLASAASGRESGGILRIFIHLDQSLGDAGSLAMGAHFTPLRYGALHPRRSGCGDTAAVRQANQPCLILYAAMGSCHGHLQTACRNWRGIILSPSSLFNVAVARR